MRNKKFITEEEIERARQMRLKFYSIKQIAAELGRGYSNLSLVLKKRGIT